LWKAGRYKLAAPVSKTGSVTTEVGALPTPSASLRQPHVGWRGLPTAASAKVGLTFRLQATAGRPIKPSTRGAHNENHSAVRAEVATREATKACTAKTENRQQEGPTGPPNPAEADPLSDLFPRRQSCRISSAVAAVSQMKNGERRVQSGSSFYILNSAFREAANETGHPLPKPTAPTTQLQAKSCSSNSPDEAAI
jgi:hypothetical protein